MRRTLKSLGTFLTSFHSFSQPVPHSWGLYKLVRFEAQYEEDLAKLKQVEHAGKAKTAEAPLRTPLKGGKLLLIQEPTQHKPKTNPFQTV
eukprot:1665011-Amphidinium_carterae.1